MTKKDRMEALLGAKLPSVYIKNLDTVQGGTLDLKLRYKFRKGGQVGATIFAYVDGDPGRHDAVTLADSTLKHYLEGNMTLDELCQDKEVLVSQSHLAQELVNGLDDVDRSKLNDTYLEDRLDTEPYIPQEMVLEGKDLSRELLDLIEKPGNGASIPEQYKVPVPKHIIPDKEVVNSVLGYVAEGTPCVAMLGPTGSGKSLTARFIGSILHNYGYGVFTVDANERTEGDRLFDRDDFNQEGTFILEGTLLGFAREMKSKGLRGLVILEEYNAFNDATRREFYRLFSDRDRYYQVESSHTRRLAQGTYDKRTNGDDSGSVIQNRVPFDHIQFLITANPIASGRYLMDDLKRLSNAESRRVTIVYHDYVQKKVEIIDILKSILRSKPILVPLSDKHPGFPGSLKFDKGADCFKLLNTPDSMGNRLGYDFGYTDVANWVWTAAIRGNTVEAWISSSLDHLLNPVPDHEIRKDVADKLDSKFGIKIERSLILRDS